MKDDKISVKDSALKKDALKAKFSIIIPVYNIDEKYLHKCILTLQEQTLKDIEIIIINDGSTNNCGSLCDAYSKADTRIKVIHQENKGVSAARNRGIQEATSRWIIFIDPDDWVELNMCEELDKYLMTNNADILMFTYYSNFKDREISHYYGTKEDLMFKTEEHELLQLSIMKVYSGFYPLMIGSVVMKVFNKEFLTTNNIYFNENLPKSQDLIFSLYAIEYAKKIAFINRTFYHYRQNDASICHRYNPNIFSFIMRTAEETENFINMFDKKMSFQVGYFHMIASLFFENMFLDFLHRNNVNNYRSKRKMYIDTLNSEPFKTTFINLDLRSYSGKMKVLLWIIKRKWYLPLYFWYLVIKREKNLYGNISDVC